MMNAIRVLHVDDEPDFVEMAATFLEREEHRITVETATRPVDGLEHLRADSIDCVVSDHDMPGENGIEFLESVREEFPDLPFILFTGKGSEEIASKAISAGVTDYIQKSGGTDQYALLANRITNAVEFARSQDVLAARNRELRSYERMINSMREAACIYDASGRLKIVNEYLADWYDTTREELEGNESTLIAHIRETTGGDPYQALLDGDRVEIRGEVETEFPGRGHAAIEYRLTPLTVDGTIEGVVGVARDITERKEREKELQDEQQFVQSIFRSLPDPLYAFDTDGYPIRWSDRLETITGYSHEEMRETHVTEFVPDSEVETVSQAFQTILSDGCRVTVDSALETKDGDRIPYEFTGGPLTDGDGTLRGVAGVGRDTTQRGERERELERTRDLLAQTERIAAVGGWELDTDTMDVFWTDNLFELLGIDGDEEPSLSAALDFYHEADRPVVEKAIDDALDEGEPFDIEVRFQRPDGEIRWLRVKGEPTTSGGDVVTLRGAIQDITARKHDEQTLKRQNDRLNRFASVVSHDLRNPLNVASGQLEFAREETDSDRLDAVAHAHDRMERIIDDVLWLAREGQDIGSTEPVALREVVASAWKIATHERGTLEIDIPTDPSRPIEADDDRLHQLLENLFRNAVEHGTADVTVTVGELDTGFYVADDGPGIPESNRDAVFDDGYSTAEEGTGFGLAIVKQIVDAHGWTIRVTESDHGGARFEIRGVSRSDR